MAELLLAQVDALGQPSYYLAKAEPVHDAQGRVNGSIVILVDITAQRQAEQQMRQHAPQMDVVVESIREGVVIYNIDRRPLRYNPAAERILGWAAAGRDPLSTTEEERWAFYDIRSVTGQPLDRSYALPLQQALAGEAPAPIEVSMQHPDQSRHIISIAISPLRDFATGRIFGAVGAYRDLTEQYLLEQMREEFLNMASHELRTPLTAMMLANYIMQQRLRRVADRDELLKLNDDMGMQIRRLNRLANNLLDLTSLIGNRFSINLVAFDAAQVIRETVEDQRNTSKRMIILTGASEPIQAAIDAQRLSQVLVNLLSNAIVHSAPSTPVEIDVRLAGTAQSPRLHVSVRDHGAGIPKEKLATIFERFAPTYTDPLTAASTVTGSGLGFGLYLARAIIQAHGGEIWADSNVGHGSTFTFELPLPFHEGGLS